MIEIFSFSYDITQVWVIMLVAFLVGMSKTGIHGTSMLSVPVMAIYFGGQSSSGIILPMLIIADIFGVIYYHRHAEWSYLKKLFPWAAVGIILGTWVGTYINDSIFRAFMAVIIVLSVMVMIWMERTNREKIPKHPAFAASMGIAGGFTSMIGNLAGTVMAVYFLSMKLNKNSFIGTTAWFFFVINVFKVPFHVFVWHTIHWDGFVLNLLTIPAILLGAYVGITVVKQLTDKTFRWFIIAITLLASVIMLLK
ncbi:sulfite exporter TauE/SafE family protein [Pedobacter aquae]|uniref:Probable membrane transporter protein n=1 Tax=Pedobacter aquae TaxID=2605747 RepID=A0A5C0VIR6_9SPHI|nr:sulfite exporter TauE/SafE family protein [Pedobacter aquae]QEK51663.1 sulfite exporter TauE/SafE family protein [Pedobacter aquae]